jgi:hypothetical protein
MITFEEFETAINQIEKINYICDELYRLNINIVDSELHEGANLLFSCFINSHFTKVGKDLVSWWVYEDVNKILYDPENPSIIVADVTDIEDLWKYMIEEPQTYFKNV